MPPDAVVPTPYAAVESGDPEHTSVTLDLHVSGNEWGPRRQGASGPAWRGKLRAERVFGPRVLRVAPRQFSPDTRVVVHPEPGEVARDLDRPLTGSEQVEDDRHLARTD